MYDRVRGQDIRLLQFFGITYIFDLMLEMKKVKFGMKSVPLLPLATFYTCITCSVALENIAFRVSVSIKQAHFLLRCSAVDY